MFLSALVVSDSFTNTLAHWVLELAYFHEQSAGMLGEWRLIAATISAARWRHLPRPIQTLSASCVETFCLGLSSGGERCRGARDGSESSSNSTLKLSTNTLTRSAASASTSTGYRRSSASTTSRAGESVHRLKSSCSERSRRCTQGPWLEWMSKVSYGARYKYT